MPDFKGHLKRLEEFLRGLPDCPAWKTIEIVETDQQGNIIGVPVTVEQFEDRFDMLMKAGLPWINLSALGTHADNLVVTVEKPQPTGSTGTSVNLSGPPDRVRKQPGWRIKIG
jgi:hypothetical protein